MFWIGKSLKVEDHKSNLGKSIRNTYLRKVTTLNMTTGKMTGQDMSIVIEEEVEAVEVVEDVEVTFSNVSSNFAPFSFVYFKLTGLNVTGNRYDGSPDWKHDKFHEVQDNQDEEMFENY